MRTARIVGMLTAVGLAASAASAALPKVILSEVAASSTSQVVLSQGTGTIDQIDRPYRSLTSGHWIISASVATPAGGPFTTAVDDIVFTGTGMTPTLRVQEGTTNLEAGRVCDSSQLDDKLGINDSGDFVFAANLSGATTDDEVIMKSVAGVFSVAVREGGAIPSLPGLVNGPTNNHPNISNAGNVSYRTFAIPAPATSGNNIAIFRNEGNVLDGRSGVTVPAGQQGIASTWQNIQSTFSSSGSYWVSADNNHWLVTGDTNATDTTRDGLVVVDGSVVLQEGFVIPGSSLTATIDGMGHARMEVDGSWWARGSLNDSTVSTADTDFVVIDGNVIALTGQTITGSTTEKWSGVPFADTFFSVVTNNAGDYVIGGTTDAADANANAVIVLNGSTELLREGDAVDLNGNGLADDGVFVGSFGNDDMILDGNCLYLVITLEDAAGASLGDAYVTLKIPAPGSFALLGLAGLAASRRRRA